MLETARFHATCLFLAATALACIASYPIRARSKYPPSLSGKVVAINSPTEWCMILPPNEGEYIADHEHDGVSFCSTPIPPDNAPGARTFPEGFILSAHYLKTDTYVQVTGRFDRSKYALFKSDGGGQFDQKLPQSSFCSGFKRYVNMVEPDVQRYCIRCCVNDDPKLCNIFLSEYGCDRIIPGDYNYTQSDADGMAPSVSISGLPTIVVPTQTSGQTIATPTAGSSVFDPPEFPWVTSPTFVFNQTQNIAQSWSLVTVAGDSGCVDLYPDGTLDWPRAIGGISYATAFLPAGVRTTIRLYAEENCVGEASFEVDRSTILTGKPTLVDLLPDFYGNASGPQSAAITVNNV